MIVSKSELQQFYDEKIAGHPTEHFKLGAELYYDLSSDGETFNRDESKRKTVRLDKLAEKHQLPMATVRDALNLRKNLWEYNEMRTEFLKRNPLSQDVNRMPTADSILLRGSVEKGSLPKLLGDVSSSEYARVYEEERGEQAKMSSMGISSVGSSRKSKPVKNVNLSRYMTPKKSMVSVRPEVKDRMSDYRAVSEMQDIHALSDDSLDFEK